jgi:hypothetical protein
VNLIFRIMNKANTLFIEPATADKQLPDGHNVVANNPLAADIAAGRVFINGGVVAISAAENGDFHFENPVGSQKLITIYGFSVNHDQLTSRRVEFWRGSTAATPNTISTELNHNFSRTNTAGAVVKSGKNIITGGTKLDITTRIGVSGASFGGVPLLEFAPGETIALRVTASPGLVGDANLDFGVLWKEEDL